MNQFHKIILCSTLLIPSLTPMTTFAIDKDAVQKNGEKNDKNSHKKIQEASESSTKEQASQGHDIKSEAYTMFDTYSKGFGELEANYGRLSDENTSSGFKAYLAQISQNKENAALNYKLAAQKAGKYSISADGLVSSQDKADNLVDSMFGSDEKKKEALQSQGSSQKDNKVSTDGNVFGGDYFELVNKDKSDFENSQSNTIKEFGQQSNSNQNTLNSSKGESIRVEENAKNTYNTIQKSYTSLREAIKKSTDAYSQAKKEATQKKFSAKVAGFDAAKNAANPKNATLKATKPKTASKSGTSSSKGSKNSTKTVSQSTLFANAKKKAEQDYLQKAEQKKSETKKPAMTSKEKLDSAIEKKAQEAAKKNNWKKK